MMTNNEYRAELVGFTVDTMTDSCVDLSANERKECLTMLARRLIIEKAVRVMLLMEALEMLDG